MEIFVSQVTEKLAKASSIYDVIAILFCSVTIQGEQKNIRLHRQWRDARRHGAELSQIVQLMSCHPQKDFPPGLQELIRFYEKYWEDAVPLMIEALFCFDNELSELPPPQRSTDLINHGPMNNPLCQNMVDACLYLLPQQAVQQSFFDTYGLRRGGKLLTSHPSGLQRKLKNYAVIPRVRLGALSPQIWAYYPKEAIQNALRDSPLRIAVFSFGNKPWFSAPSTPDGEGLDVRYTPGQDADIIEAYKCALRLAEKHKADIVVFPELALGASARGAIQAYLRQSLLEREHTKLIFAGTEWVNSKNAAYVFTAGGTPLLTQLKREPFDQHDKETGVTRRENLADHDNLLLFLDVAGLGRVSYIICRDFLDMAESVIRADLLGSSLMIASCYTGELGPFITMADGLARQYGAVSLVVNSCAAVRQKEPLEGCPAVGLLGIPTCNERKQLGCCPIPYTTYGGLCTSDNCGLCSCMDVYTLRYSSGVFSVDCEKIKKT